MSCHYYKTKEEKIVLNHLKNGFTVAMISKTTSINIRTLEAMIVRLRKRFNAENATHLVVICIKNKFIDL